MFELSPQTYAVTGTKGRLHRTFPGAALSIPLKKIETAFIKTLAQTLERMSGQVVPDTLPSSKKAGQSHEETRDTASPKMVTELLTAFLLPGYTTRSNRPPSFDINIWSICFDCDLATRTLTTREPSASAAATIGTMTDDLPSPMFSCMTACESQGGFSSGQQSPPGRLGS